jgi:ABC-2 type transport system permease protein
LVTPISKLELILGFTFAGAAKAILAGFVLVTLGSIIAGIPDPLNLVRLARMLLLVIVTSLALISMMFLIMVRVNDPLVPRAIFGVLTRLSLLEGAGMRKRLKINLRLAKVCSHFPTLLLP